MKCLKIEDFKYFCIDQDYCHYIEIEPLKQAGNYMVYDRNITLPEEFQYGISIILSTECMLQELLEEEPREKVDRFISMYNEQENIIDENPE
jgi:hypothetical protein